MSDYIKQHILSKTYLKYFSPLDNGKSIFVFKEKDEYRRYIQKCNSGDAVFWERNFFNSEEFSTPTALEKFFATEIEPEYNRIIKEVELHKPISDVSIKNGLFKWIIYSKLRSPIWRGYYLDLLSNTPTILDKERSLLLAKELHLNFFTNNNVLSKVIDQFVNTLANKKWRILSATGNDLWWTTDNPGFSLDLNEQENTSLRLANPFWNLLDNNTLIYYPLTKKYCLEIGPYNSDDSVHLNFLNDQISHSPADKDMIELINYYTLITQHELLISADEDSLKKILQISLDNRKHNNS